MEISYLREFVELAKTCRFQEAAESLYISQSTLSKHIQAIEKELGAELFVRTTRHVELSEIGRAFLPYASQISLLQKDYTQELVKTDVTRRIRVGSDAAISLRQMERFLSSYVTRHPNIQFEMMTADKNYLRSHLRSGDLDMAVVCRDLSDTDSEFFSCPYYSDKLVAVMSEHNPLHDADSVTIEQIRQYPMVQQGSINFAQYLDPTVPPAQYKSDHPSLLTQILNESQAIEVCGTNAALFLTTNDLAKNLHILPVVPTTQIHIDVICLKMRANTPLIQSLIEHLRRNEELLINESGFDIHNLHPSYL